MMAMYERKIGKAPTVLNLVWFSFKVSTPAG